MAAETALFATAQSAGLRVTSALLAHRLEKGGNAPSSELMNASTPLHLFLSIKAWVSRRDAA